MSLTWRRSRITGAGLVAAQYDLTLERQTTMDNTLFIPGIANPVSEINQLLFGQGQQGTFIAPSLTASLISGSTFGTGVETLPDLSPRNNPFSQANSGNRAAWFREPKTGRRNLLIRTQEFNDTAWTKTNVTITPNAVTAPDGTLTAALMVNDSTNGEHRVLPASTVSVSGAGTATVFAKAGTASFISVGVNGFANSAAVFNLDTGVISNQGAFVTNSSMVDAGNGWYRCRVTVSTSVNRCIVNMGETAADAVPQVNSIGTGKNVFIWATQLEAGSTATAYQRVTTAFDVTEAGQRDCFGVRADGIDDGYATAGNVDFSGTDAVTIFAAMRKVGTTSATFCELSVQADTNNGAFYLRAPLSSTDSYDVLSRGTANARLVPTAFPSPITNILTAQFRISTDFANLRVDGTSVLSVSTDQGSGNYGNYPLFLMARNNTTSRFNGDLYALIIAGGSYPLSTIQRVERLLSRITPTVNL
jgi:hypothetical protein